MDSRLQRIASDGLESVMAQQIAAGGRGAV